MTKGLIISECFVISEYMKTGKNMGGDDEMQVLRWLNLCESNGTRGGCGFIII